MHSDCEFRYDFYSGEDNFFGLYLVHKSPTKLWVLRRLPKTINARSEFIFSGQIQPCQRFQLIKNHDEPIHLHWHWNHSSSGFSFAWFSQIAIVRNKTLTISYRYSLTMQYGSIKKQSDSKRLNFRTLLCQHSFENKSSRQFFKLLSKPQPSQA